MQGISKLSALLHEHVNHETFSMVGRRNVIPRALTWHLI